jgi:hypothetical protein
VIKKKDSTYSKIQILSQLADKRYLFKYGVNTTPNDKMLDSATYDPSIRYKPNNAVFFYQYGLGDSILWEPPLQSNNHLIGYIFYTSKNGVVIDTTAPINLAQWDSVFFADSTKTKSGRLGVRDLSYMNLVAVYAEGKSDFLQGWTLFYTAADAIKQASSSSDRSRSRMEIKKASGGYFISLPQLRENTAPSSLAVFNAAGEKVAYFSVVNGNGVLWKTDNLSEGTYLIRAELPDKSVLTRTIVFSR